MREYCRACGSPDRLHSLDCALRPSGIDVTKDPLSAHEAMDRAHIMAQMFDECITAHLFVDQTPELKEAAAKIADLLGEFYQLAGKYALDGAGG